MIYSHKMPKTLVCIEPTIQYLSSTTVYLQRINNFSKNNKITYIFVALHLVTYHLQYCTRKLKPGLCYINYIFVAWVSLMFLYIYIYTFFNNIFTMRVRFPFHAYFGQRYLKKLISIVKQSFNIYDV